MRVILLTRADCDWCTAAKALLARLTQEFSLEVQEVDVSSTQGRALRDSHRVFFLPGLVCNGCLIGSGRVRERAVRRQLARLVVAEGAATRPSRSAHEP